MIPRIKLSEIWHITMRRSTLITIPKLADFFEFNNEFKKDEVFYGIVRDALDKYQYYYPLYRIQKTYITVDGNNIAYLHDNFKGYLNGVIDEDQLFLLPGAVIGLGYYAQVGTTYPLRNFRYENGQFSDFWYPSSTYWVASLCSYPFPELFKENGESMDECAVYFMEKDSGVRFKIFKDQVYVELCRYIWNMRQNMMLSNLPIEVFSGLQEDSQRVTSELENIYQQALQSSAWLM